MADKKDDKKKDAKKTHHSSGGMGFGTEIIIFLIVLFILWAAMKKPTETTNKPFIKTDTTSIPQ